MGSDLARWRERGGRVGEDLAGAEVGVGADGLGGGGDESDAARAARAATRRACFPSLRHGQSGARQLSRPRPALADREAADLELLDLELDARPIVARPIARRPTESRPIAKPPTAAAPTASAPIARARARADRRRRSPVGGRACGLKRADAAGSLDIAATVARLVCGPMSVDERPTLLASSTSPGRGRTGSSTPATASTSTP